MAPKGSSKQQSEEDLLLQDFSRNLSAKSSALFFGNAFIVSAIPICELRGGRGWACVTGDPRPSVGSGRVGSGAAGAPAASVVREAPEGPNLCLCDARGRVPPPAPPPVARAPCTAAQRARELGDAPSICTCTVGAPDRRSNFSSAVPRLHLYGLGLLQRGLARRAGSAGAELGVALAKRDPSSLLCTDHPHLRTPTGVKGC